MADNPRPLLVYNRIGRNHRNTRLLLALVPLLLLPFAAGIAVFLTPWLLFYVSWSPEWLEHPLRFELFVSTVAAAIVVAIMTLVTIVALMFYRFGMLRSIGAAPVTRQEEPELSQIVENLCIGAGLPQPQLRVVESAVPNAFATGPDPARATLCATRGLLTLLDRRELEGVVAHELSHIGNHDTRLATAVAAIVTALRFPIGIVVGVFRALSTLHPAIGALFLLGFVGMIGVISALSLGSIFFLREFAVPRWIVWRQIFVTLTPVYVCIGAPAIGLLIRQAVSRQREFLADADAVQLTRDPEGLALALTKIGAWHGPGTLNVGSAAAHFCIADPLPPDASWWMSIFPCHPPIKDRVALLARMGSGISTSALNAAADAGAQAGLRKLEKENPSDDAQLFAESQPEDVPRPVEPGSTIVYEKPDGWSNVVDHLPEGAMVTVCGSESSFLRITTAANRSGYISASARGHVTERAKRQDADVTEQRTHA